MFWEKSKHNLALQPTASMPFERDIIPDETPPHQSIYSCDPLYSVLIKRTGAEAQRGEYQGFTSFLETACFSKL